MPNDVSIYCDESCHLSGDRQKAMVLGAISADRDEVKRINAEILEIKDHYGVGRHSEIKWRGVSHSRLDYYLHLVEYYFSQPELGFRAWVVPDKSILDHDRFAQTHDDWYYKMYFYLLRNLLSSNHRYYIYIDIKDTRSRDKLRKLQEVLSNARYDFSRSIIKEMKHVHSKDVPILQLTDLLAGAISYRARGLTSSPAKLALIESIERLSGFTLSMNTLPSEYKMNLCFWRPRSGECD